MTDKLLDWAVVILPTVIGILGTLFSLKSPPEAALRKWRYAFIVAGLVISGLAYWQQSRSCDSHAAEIRELGEALGQNQRQLQKAIEEAEARLGIRFDLAFQLRERDTARVAALQTVIRNYARDQETKQRLDDKELRQRAFAVVRKMREFRVSFDYEQSEINRRFLKDLAEAQAAGDAEVRDAEERLKSIPKIVPSRRIDAEPVGLRQPNQGDAQQLDPRKMTAEQINAKEKEFERRGKQPEAERKALEAQSRGLDDEIKRIEEQREQTSEGYQKLFDAMNRRRAALDRVLDKSNEEAKALTERYAAEFRSLLLGEAAYLRDEMLKRLPPQPQAPAALILTFQGVLISSRAIGTAADYLETLTERLSP